MQQLTYIVSGTADAQRQAEQAKEKLDRIPYIASLLITVAAPCEMALEKALQMRDALRELFPHARILVHTCALKMADLRLDTAGVMLTITAFEESQADFVIVNGQMRHRRRRLLILLRSVRRRSSSSSLSSGSWIRLMICSMGFPLWMRPSRCLARLWMQNR